MRRLGRIAPIVAFAVTLSCADMPTAPRPIVTVTGQITDRDGPGIEQVYLTFESLDPRDQPVDLPMVPTRPPPGPSTHTVSTVTDGSGRYRILLPAGPYNVYLDPRDGYPSVRLTSVNIGRGQNEVNYHYTGVRVTGTITGPGGMALSDGGMSATRTPSSAYVSSGLLAGRYSLLLPPGNYDLLASGRAVNTGLPYVRFQGVSVNADTTIDVVLDGVRVTGTVRGQGGSPLYHILVEARGYLYGPVRAYSEADGVYTIYLPPGVYDFNVQPWEYHWLIGRDFPSIPINTAQTLDFDLSGVEWSGTVRRSADSAAMAGVLVHATEEEGYRYASVVTDAQGAFRLIVRPGVLYEVGVRTATQSHVAGDFATAADSTFDIYLDAPLP